MGSLKTKWIIFLLLSVILTIPLFFRMVRPGFFPIQDDMQVFRLYELDKCVKDLQIPCRWIPDGGFQYGYPQFNFYAPFVYYLGEIFHLSGFQFIDSIKIVFVLGFVLSAVTMFILAGEFFGKFPAFVAAVLYSYAPYHAQQVYVRGSLSEFWASVFFPLILWAIYKLIKTGGKKYLFWTSSALAGLFLTHNILAFLFIPVVVFWILFWMVAEKRLHWKKLILALVLGIGLSAFFVLPMMIERNYAHTETLLGGYFDYRQHFVTLKELFLSNHWGYGSSFIGPVDDLNLSTGIVHWIIGFIAVIVALFTFRKNRKISLLVLSLGAIELVILFLTHEKSSFVWSTIPQLAWLQFPWRFLSLSVFLLSFLSAFAVHSIGKIKYLFGVLIISAVVILQVGFFAPKTWLDVTDKDQLTGTMWEKELTASIFDYLPIYAKLPPDSKAPDTPEILTGKAEFVNYTKGTDSQKGELNVKSVARIRLPFFDFPGMTVRLNGRVMSHINNDCSGEKFCMGLIAFDAPVGNHAFTVELEDTPVRTFGNVASLVSFLVLGFFLIKKDVQVLKK